MKSSGHGLSLRLLLETDEKADVVIPTAFCGQHPGLTFFRDDHYVRPKSANKSMYPPKHHPSPLHAHKTTYYRQSECSAQLMRFRHNMLKLATREKVGLDHLHLIET